MRTAKKTIRQKITYEKEMYGRNKLRILYTDEDLLYLCEKLKLDPERNTVSDLEKRMMIFLRRILK